MKATYNIYIIALLSGAVLLGLELLASRLLAPFFGNSIYVWGAIISVFLLSLSLGYFLGGKVADKLPSFNTLGRIIVVTAVFTLLIPFLTKPLCYSILTLQLDVRIAVLSACLGVFLIPSILMGMVSPYIIKLSAEKLENIGQTAGNVYAVSTLGSISGAILVSFFLIPAIGSKAIIFLCTGTLLVAAGLCFVTERALKNS